MAWWPHVSLIEHVLVRLGVRPEVRVFVSLSDQTRGVTPCTMESALHGELYFFCMINVELTLLKVKRFVGHLLYIPLWLKPIDTGKTWSLDGHSHRGRGP